MQHVKEKGRGRKEGKEKEIILNGMSNLSF